MINNLKLKYWLPVFIWMSVIYLFSAQPGLKASSIDWQDLIIRKIAHITEYFILFRLVYSAIDKTTVHSIKWKLLVSVFISLMYAVSDETHQLYVNNRQGRITDVLIDSIGIISAYLSVIKPTVSSPRKL